MKKVVLFDMDGTLTPAREKMDQCMIKPIYDLQQNGFEVAIVSGSDFDYIQEQCDALLDINPVDQEKIHYMPCNGTKYYTFSNGSFRKQYELDMKKSLGIDNYNNLIKILLESQLSVRYCLGGSKIPLSGTFIQYRGSMINWCPIGRDATKNEREQWLTVEKKNGIRESMLRRLSAFPVFDMLEVKLGGETSLDIYPCGWDKTYAWNIFEDYEEIYFVGDRCFPKGNDYEAYLKAGPNGYQTSGPVETKRIISEILGR